MFAFFSKFSEENKREARAEESEVETMAVWKCKACGETKEGRCRPGKCPTCGAPKESFEKAEEPAAN